MCKYPPSLKLPHILTALGINAVPAFGWFVGEWSGGTTLLIYWFENVAAAVLIAARILIHRRLVPFRGHFKYGQTTEARNRSTPGTFLQHFLPIALAFSAVHGIFLAALIFLLTHNGKGAEIQINLEEVLIGSGLILGLLVLDFLMDLPGLKSKSFRWIEQMGERNIARVFIVHMTLILGMLAVAFMGGTRAFFTVFVFLKTMNDLSAVFPQYDPKEPPRWLCALMDCVPNPKKGESFAAFWKKDKQAEWNRQEGNEKLMT